MPSRGATRGYFFQHDLLGDWARLRVLMGEHPVSAQSVRQRAANPRWHNALRLFGVWLLEDRFTGLEGWRRLIDESHEADERALHSLLLEAVFIASDVGGLLQRLWPSLVADNGKLLASLLDRFLYAATVPDPRLANWGIPSDDIAHVEHSFRIPIWAQWGAVLQQLHAYTADLVSLAPTLAARICRLWLSTTPAGVLWRREAAELAIAVAREIHAQRAEGNLRLADGNKIVFEALLWATPVLPEEVSDLCLQFAERRDLPPHVRERVERAKAEREQRAKQQEVDNPELAVRRAKLSMPAFPRGPLREPWTDGPHREVCEPFRSVCLNSESFTALARTAPQVALEVLLAVCIEEPQHEDPYNAHHDDVGLTHWHEGYPPLFFRGPFLQFLRVAPEQGLSCVLRLVNFATRRSTERASTMLGWRGIEVEPDEIHVVVEVNGHERKWFGEGIFEWHYWGGNMGVAVLQALERSLYDLMDEGNDMTATLARVMSESESLAFAGLLIDVGKRQPSLFETVLRPLLAVAELYPLDMKASMRRASESASEMIGWNGKGEQLWRLAHEWYSAEHRKLMLRDVVVDLLFRREELREFFKPIREAWMARLGDAPPDSPLRLLCERFDLANYSAAKDGDGNLDVQLHWPADVQQAINAKQPASDAGLLLMSLPMRCRKLLQAGKPLLDSERDALWLSTQEAHGLAGQGGSGDGDAIFTEEDAVCAGIAALLTLHRAWLEEEPERVAWCRAYLESSAESEFPRAALGIESGLGDHHWDCFAAECGLELLRTNREDALARRLVAQGVTAHRYAATERTMLRGFEIRDRLGDDFKRMQSLAVSWSALRRERDHLSYSDCDTSACDAAQSELVRKFTAGELPAARSSLADLNGETRSRLFRADQERARTAEFAGRAEDPRVLAVDVRALRAAFSWLHLASARSAIERDEWRSFLGELLALSLGQAPQTEDGRDGPSGYSGPHEFDYWIFQLVAENLNGLRDSEQEQALWKTILDLPRAAHRWVAAYCSAWLSYGLGADTSREWFTAAWSQMIQHALASELWASRYYVDYDLSRMVIDLLGFGGQGRRLFSGDDGAQLLQEMLPVLDSAAARWFELSPVVQAFASLATSLDSNLLLIPGIRWIRRAIEHAAVSDDVELDAHLVEFLRKCWLKERARMQRDPELTRLFRDLLDHASARASHAAATLRDQVLNSVSAE